MIAFQCEFNHFFGFLWISLEHGRVLDDHVYIVMLQLLHSVIDVP